MAIHNMQHGLGSTADHTSATLAQINALVSDATLDDSGDARTPSSHAASHQNGGGDEVSVAGLSGLLADNQNPTAHAGEHTDGTDDIQDAGAAQKGLVSTGAQTLAGVKTFSAFPVTPSSDPTTDYQVANKQYVDGKVVGLYEHKGAYNASTNSPDLDTSPSGILKGDAYTVSVAGNFFTEACEIGDVLIADQDDPTALAHWTRVNKNISFGTTAGTACEGNDSRLSDDRDPNAHASTHQSGGGDAIKIDDLAAADDNTDLNASTGAHGLLPKLSGTATEYLNGSGSFSTPPGTAPQVESAAGVTPVDTDVSGWSNDTFGVVVGTGGRVFFAFKNGADVYYVEATAI